ncbi:MAG: hypothetical protein ACXWBN_05140 [Acidimicrobiales bacterium]
MGHRTNPYRKRLILVAIVAIITLVANGCYFENVYSNKSTGPYTIQLGDSISSNAGAVLHDTLDPSYQYKLSGWIGGRFDQGISEGTKYLGQSPLPTRIVIQYGTNDSTLTDSLQTIESKMDSVIRLFPHDCEVLVNVGSWIPTVNPDHRADIINGLNYAISQGAQGVIDREQARVQEQVGHAVSQDDIRNELQLGPILQADYDSVMGANLAANFVGDTKHLIHPGAVGDEIFANLVKSTLDQCPAEVDPVTTTTTVDVTTTADPTTTVPVTDTTETTILNSTTVTSMADPTTTVATDPSTTDTTVDTTPPSTDEPTTTVDPPPDTAVP